MNLLYTITTGDLNKVNSGQFAPTVVLTDARKHNILDGKMQLRRGQWVVDGRSGIRGQFLGVKQGRKLGNLVITENVIRIRQAIPGLTFRDYQDKLEAA